MTQVLSTATTLVAQKVTQAQAVLRELGLDVWIVQFGQETETHPEPMQPLLVGVDVTWLAAFIIPAHGEPVAIVGKGDVEKIRAVGAYPQILGYVQGISEPLREVLTKLNPTKIGVTTSQNDSAADGITLGNYRLLQKYLRGTPFAGRLVSAEAAASRVRSRKLPEEVRRVRRACELTVELFGEITARLRPGVTGLDVLEFAHGWMRERSLAPAWEASSCPCVPIGPRSPVGHVPAGNIPAAPGDLIFCDVGVVFEGYRSDMQRTWYMPLPGENAPPANVQRAWETLMRAVKAGVRRMTPGAKGYQVDAAARSVITRAGYPAPEFAFGHHLGATAHDGAGVLGPRWERYGRAPYFTIEPDQVFATEYAIPTSDPYVGWVSVEDDLRVTPEGAEWLVPPQREIWLARNQ